MRRIQVPFVVLAAPMILAHSVASSTDDLTTRPQTISVTVATPAPANPESFIIDPVDIGAAAVPPPAIQPVHGIRQLTESTLLQGANSAALAGDYLLQNERITVVVSAPEHPVGTAASGGNIIDAFTNDHAYDQLAQVHLYLNDRYPRQARYSTVRIATAGPGDDTLALEAAGVDTSDPSIEIMTTYTLPANSSAVEIATAVTCTSHPISNYPVGDVLGWGPARPFVSNEGFGISSGRVDSPWIGAAGKGVAYGLYAQAPTLWGPVGPDWADVSGTTASLEAGQTMVYRRHFVVGRDLAEVQQVVLAAKGVKTTAVEGTVTEEDSERPANRVPLFARSGGKTVSEAFSQDGRFEMFLPDGGYTITVEDPVRAMTCDPAVLSLPADAGKPITLRVMSPAIARIVVKDSEGGTPLPCKATFVGTRGTSDPNLGPPHERAGQNVVHIADGQENVAVPAGSYDIVISRGLEYHVTTHSVTLHSNRQTLLETRLVRAVTRRGLVSGDFHQHMRNSFDSAVPPEDRVISNACEGLDFFVSTDHNFNTDLSPVVRQLGLDRWIRSIIGDEVTPRRHYFGHFNAFPLVADTGQPRNGPIEYEGTIAARVFEAALAFPGEQVVQVNHPRSGDLGYFNKVGMSKADGTTTHLNWSDHFSAIEIFNGKHLDDAEESLRDWFNLLNIGYVFTATGNSDSHRIHDQEPGYPRNYVDLGVSQASQIREQDVVRAVNDRHAVFATNGPILSFRTQSGGGIGSTCTLVRGPVRFKVRIEGANFVQPSVVQLIGNGRLLEEVRFAETSSSLKWDGTLADEPTSDTWYVIVCRGTRSLEPVVKPLGDITATPFAFTNPIWVDRDGDGLFSAPNSSLMTMMDEDRAGDALSALDRLTSESQRRTPRPPGAKRPAVTAGE